MRVLLTTWGSQGDFYPFLALGRALLRRGHTVTLVGDPLWREASVTAGFRFRASGPEDGKNVLHRHPEVLDQRWMGLVSLHHLMHKGILPVLPTTYQVLLEEQPQHDLLVAHHFVFAAGMVHEKTRIPWVTVCLAPSVTPSAWHQPAASWQRAPRNVGQRATVRLAWTIGRRLIGPVVDRPLNVFRRQLGLPPQKNHFFASRSSELVLHLYSEHFAPKPPDWSGVQILAGFCRNQFGLDYQPPVELEEFLTAGKPPMLFTLGTTVVEHPQEFFREAVEAVRGTEDRALLLIGKEENRPPNLPDNVLAMPYIPHDWIMPRCWSVVHQCGAGTLAESLAAGVPSVCCPFAFDQPNNAARLSELGVGVVLRPWQHQRENLRQALITLRNSDAPSKARSLASLLSAENGPDRAASALEKHVSLERR